MYQKGYTILFKSQQACNRKKIYTYLKKGALKQGNIVARKIHKCAPPLRFFLTYLLGAIQKLRIRGGREGRVLEMRENGYVWIRVWGGVGWGALSYKIFLSKKQ